MPSTSTDIASNADLPKIINNGESNNYAEWKTRPCRKLRGWGLWKYIEGPDSTPPEIPILRQTTIRKGKDKQGVIQEFTIDGNSAEYDKKTEEAKPWLAGNELTLDKIIDATPSEILPLVQNVPYAKQAWEVLCSTYQPQNAMRAASVMGDITSYRCTPDMDKYTLGWRGPWNVHLPTDQCNRGNNVPPTSHPAYAKYAASSSSKPSAVYFTHSTAQPQDPNAHYAQDSNFQLSHMDTSASITTEDSKPVIHAALCHETPGHTWLDNLDNEVLVATVLVLEDALPILDACYHDTGAN